MGALGPGIVLSAALLGVLAVEGEQIAESLIDGDLTPFLKSQGATANAVVDALKGDPSGLMEAASAESQALGTIIFNVVIDDLLHVREGATEADAADAIKVLEHVLGISAQLPLAFAQVGGIAKLFLGNRAEAFESSAIAHLPEELGLGFFLAEILASLFRTAVGTPLEESINLVHRPARIDNTTIRRLLQQHKIDESTARHFLSLQGYPDELQGIFLLADQSFLSIAEMQEAYLQGFIDPAGIGEQLQRVGYDDQAIEIIVALIVQKSQTQGGDFLRSVARSLVERGEITPDMFAALLRQANVPEASIILELEAIDLLAAAKHTNLTVGQIKSAYLDGVLSFDTAMLDLQTLDYTPEDANLLIQTWLKDAVPKSASIPENRIMTFLLSHIITEQQAIDLLVAQGVKQADATFLVAHPSSVGSTFRYNLTPATVLSALKESVITVETAKILFQQLNVDPDEANLQITTVQLQQQKKNTPKPTVKTLTVADIKAAFSNEIIAPSAVTRFLKDFGYNDTDATLLFATWTAEVTGAPPQFWIPIT